MDWVLVLLVILLIVVLTAFLMGMLPYPIGLLVLLVLIGMRIVQSRNKTPR